MKMMARFMSLPRVSLFMIDTLITGYWLRQLVCVVGRHRECSYDVHDTTLSTARISNSTRSAVLLHAQCIHTFLFSSGAFPGTIIEH